MSKFECVSVVGLFWFTSLLSFVVSRLQVPRFFLPFYDTIGSSIATQDSRQMRPIYIKRDLQKRPLWIERDVHKSKETHIMKRDLNTRQLPRTTPDKYNLHTSRQTYKRDQYKSKETYLNQKETYIRQWPRTTPDKWDLYTSKETHKRDPHKSKETYINRKRLTYIKRNLQMKKDPHKNLTCSYARSLLNGWALEIC